MSRVNSIDWSSLASILSDLLMSIYSPFSPHFEGISVQITDMRLKEYREYHDSDTEIAEIGNQGELEKFEE